MTNRRMFHRWVCCLCVFLAAGCLGVATTLAEEEPEDIQKMMSPSEFKAAGLEKLSPEELDRLNAWLKGYRETTVQAAEKKATKEGRRKIDVLVSRIVGSFLWSHREHDHHAGRRHNVEASEQQRSL